ncbi:MAG: transcriptional repressor [Nitrospirae bacterium]|nr:transcriptional repressor [Nitrospirota bacterium]
MSTISQIYEFLKENGFRLTRVRKSIIETIVESVSPLSASDVKDLLKHDNLEVNKTTVYREIEFLLCQKVIQEVNVGDGKMRYELSHSPHHHHLVCVKCNKIECIEIDNCMENEKNFVSEERGFIILSHSLKFYGLCAQCK